MAVKYHLVLRKNLSREVEPGQEQLYYAQTRATRTCTFEELCDLIAESSTASSGDVKLVIDRLTKFLAKSLERGEVVQFGELGNFQLLLSSSGSLTTEAFSAAQLRKPRLCSAAQLRKPRLCFRPGALLRNLTQTVKGERITFEPVEGEDETGGSGEEEERPGGL